MDVEEEKALAARAAVARVHEGQRVALGTGTTAAFAVRAIAAKFPGGAGLSIVASSRATERYATELGLPVRALAADDRFDVMVDGADEVTPTLAMTKGGGGALFREKFLARLTKEVVIAVDHTKLVSGLGEHHAIPVEVVPFARTVVQRTLRERGLAPSLRVEAGTGATVLTDNGNELLDLQPPSPVADPRALDAELRAIPGLLETGIFVGLAHRVYIGLPDGSVQEISPPTPDPR